jgi:hypothetical protein
MQRVQLHSGLQLAHTCAQPHMHRQAACSFRWFIVAESTVRWFVVREKHCWMTADSAE